MHLLDEVRIYVNVGNFY